MRIDQVVPNLVRHDGISNHVRQVRRALRQAGFESDIWAEHIQSDLAGEGRPYVECPRRTGDRVLLFHASTHTPMAAWLAERAGAGQRLLSNYHNITPASYFSRWLPEATSSMVAAREELALLASHVELGIGDSTFNERELIDLGYRRTVTAPLLVDFDTYHATPDRRTLGRLRRQRDEGGTRWLFVGRIAPNKCQHDVIAAFAVYRKLFDPEARLVLIGGITAPRYLRALQLLAGQLDLGESVELLDAVPDGDLLAQFAVADAFVCLSEHEGFCIPVLEAMELGVPVVAYAAAALPETVADGGILLENKDPLAVACAVAELVDDSAHRGAVVAAGHRRVADFALGRTSARMIEILAEVAGAPPDGGELSGAALEGGAPPGTIGR